MRAFLAASVLLFSVNMDGYAPDGLKATEQQLLSLPTAKVDHTLGQGSAAGA